MTTTEKIPAALALPPRPERVAALRDLMGRPDETLRPLADGIRAAARRQFELHVVPRVTSHWPALLGHPFYEKLRIGSCDLYASAPYTALFCAPKRPLVVRVFTDLANALPLSLPTLARLGGAAASAFGRLPYPAHRRIMLIAAFIVVVDHVFDHCMDDPPDLREARLLRVLRGEDRATSPELRLVASLSSAMAEDLDPRERAAFEAAMDKVYGWIRAEVRAMRGEPDEAGLGHRLAGVEGTIDGLLFPITRYGVESARSWMYDVSMFVQIADDWLDYEIDLASSRTTPVLTGDWTFGDVQAAWRRSLSGVEKLARDGGLGSPGYVRFVREAYVLMLCDVIEAMAARPDS